MLLRCLLVSFLRDSISDRATAPRRLRQLACDTYCLAVRTDLGRARGHGGYRDLLRPAGLRGLCGVREERAGGPGSSKEHAAFTRTKGSLTQPLALAIGVDLGADQVEHVSPPLFQV